MTAIALELDSVSVKRGRFTLGPLSLKVDEGEVVWLSGPNGAGKSTLLMGVAGLLPICRGEVRIRERVVATPHAAVSPWERGSTLLLQQLGLWPHLTIRRQCRLVAAGAAEPARITLARKLGIEPLLDRKPATLSGGEAQRCALLRSLSGNARLLLLDEPYSEQDTVGVGFIDGVIHDLARRGFAAVVAGHRAPPHARRFELTPVPHPNADGQG